MVRSTRKKLGDCLGKSKFELPELAEIEFNMLIYSGKSAATGLRQGQSRTGLEQIVLPSKDARIQIKPPKDAESAVPAPAILQPIGGTPQPGNTQQLRILVV